MNIDVVLNALLKERAAFTEAAMSQPKGRDEFEYGRTVGTYAGLTRAISIIEGLLNKSERDLEL